MQQNENGEGVLAIAKLILFADYYANVNMPLARFYAREADKIRCALKLASVNPTVMCSHCWTILRPETCYVSILSGATAKQQILKLAKICRRTLKLKNSRINSLIAHRCLICKHRSIQQCDTAKPQKAIICKVENPTAKKPTKKESVQNCAQVSTKHNVQRTKSSIFQQSPEPKTTSASLQPGVVKKSTNHKKDLKLKHNFLKSILHKDREQRAKSSVDCLRQFFTGV